MFDGSDWFDKFTAAQAALRGSSVRVYASWWARYLDFLSHRGFNARNARTGELAAFLAQYRGNTSIRYFRLLQRVYAFAQEKGWTTHNPADALQAQFMREEDPVKVMAPGTERLTALYEPPEPGATWRQVRNRTLAVLCVEAGPRRSELLHLAWADLSLDDMAALFVRWRHGRHERFVPLSERTAALLRRWRALNPPAAGADPVFRSKPGGPTLDPSTCWRVLAKELGSLSADKSQTGAGGTQVLRAALTARLAATAPLEKVQAQLGHRQLSSTADLLARTVIRTDKTKT